MDGENETFGFNTQLLRDGVTELCFEQAMAKARFSHFCETVLMTKHINTNLIELPLEAFIMRRYAKNLMIKNNEEYLEFAYGDPFISAEFYILRDFYFKELSDLQQKVRLTSSSAIPIHGGRTIYFEKPPLVSDSEGEEESEYRKPPTVSPSKYCSPVIQPSDRFVTIFENEEMEKEEDVGGGDELRPDSHLGRNGRHLIDVSNYLLEQSAVVGGGIGTPETNQLEETLAATQFFSPGQVRRLLGSMLKVDEKETVDPWCSQFVNAFWIKIAPRMHTWSSYFPIESASPPKTNFQFGGQYYHAEQRLGSGTYGTVYLVRLIPPTLNENLPPAGGLLDATTDGCVSEQQHLMRKSAFGEGIVRVVKIQSPDSPLEFYYMREARKRVVAAFNSRKILVDVRASICPALALTHSIGRFTSILMPYFSVGLLNFLNYGVKLNKQLTAIAMRKSTKSRSTKSRCPTFSDAPPALTQKEEELVSLYLTLELLWLAEGLHAHARMIHGDIKPDNFRINDKFPVIDTSTLDDDDDGENGADMNDEKLVTANDGYKNPVDFINCLDFGRRTGVLVLLDFGLCIDMARFPPGTVFAVDKERSVKRSFPCIEMVTGQPWTFQLDLFNIAGVIYTLVFKRYMQVECVHGQWAPKYLPRTNRVYRAADVWREVLSALLNVQSCVPEDYPDLASLRACCETFLRENAANFNLAAEKANAIIHFLTSTTSSSFTKEDEK
nr:mitotic checkpoint serine:threonine protein [Hymenolepis microstoma]